MNEKIEFEGKQVVITVKKPRSKSGWVRVSYPCGDTHSFGDMSIYNKYRERAILKHLNECLACRVVLGLSKARVMRSQQQVANLFGIGKDNFKANGVESKDGFLTYYGNIRAVRTTKGIIVNSQLDFIRSGYCGVHPPKPKKNVIAELPLGTIRELSGSYDFAWMKTVEVLDQDRKGFWERNTLIIANDKRMLITRDTNHKQYVIELRLASRVITVNEAFECLKPTIVNEYEEFGVEVVRQGEFYFIPREHLKDSDVRDIQKVVRKIEVCERWDGEPKLDKTTLIFPSVTIEDTHHKATRHGIYKGLDVVKGTVRHENRDHRMLNLGDTWHIVAKNTQTSSLTVESGDAD